MRAQSGTGGACRSRSPTRNEASLRVAALYDVHAMPWALDAVLDELDVDQILFGGDFVGGPCPRETVERIRSLDATCIRGNAERDPSEWDRAKLSPDDLEWLRSLPTTATLDGVLYCHATPTDDMPMTTAATSDDEISAMFRGCTGMVVIGHTHHQFDRRVGDLRVVNAGSVGMPYEGKVAAYWLLVDAAEPQFRHTELDLDALADGILASGFPGAETFVVENVRRAVGRDEAIEHFESLRGA